MNFARSIRVITQQDLMEAGCFDFKTAIEVCREALIDYSNGAVIFPDKVSVVFDQETQDRINCLPAGFKNKGIYGMKWVSVFPPNPTLFGVPNLSAVILLSELKTGFPLAFLEGTMLSNIRTAAMSSLAARFLARRDVREIAFIGAGEQAKAHFLGMMCEFPNLKVCRVAARSMRSVEGFIRDMRKFHPEIEFHSAIGEYEKTVSGADIIVTAISGQEPILKADWISSGAFYCHVGGWEDEFAVAENADKIVCDKWDVVKHRTQTISRMYKMGVLSDDDIYADLYEIVSGAKRGRTSVNEFIYYNGVGLSFVDVALAIWAYNKVLSAELGCSITMLDKSMFE